MRSGAPVQLSAGPTFPSCVTVMVLPETAKHRMSRNMNGRFYRPVQSLFQKINLVSWKRDDEFPVRKY